MPFSNRESQLFWGLNAALLLMLDSTVLSTYFSIDARQRNASSREHLNELAQKNYEAIQAVHKTLKEGAR